MKKTFIAIFSLCLFSGALHLEAKGKYDELKKFLQRFNATSQEYIAAVEKATTPPEVLRAVQVFHRKMQTMVPRLKNLEQEFPEFKNMPEPPPEIKQEVEQLDVLGRRMDEIMREKKDLFEDEQVKKAVQEMKNSW